MTREEQKQKKYDTKYASLVECIGKHHYPGDGGRIKARAFLLKWLDQFCPYCGVKLTVFNIQVDHEVPLLRTERKLTPDEAKLLNSEENLVGCCEDCNKAKGDLTGFEFKWLIVRLSQWQRELNEKKFEDSYLMEGRKNPEIYKLSLRKGSVKYIMTKLKSGGLRYHR